MSEVFLCQTGQLNNAAKRDLRAAGIVVVEVKDPTRCQFIRSSEVISADDMVWACLDALRRDDGYGNKGTTQREALAHNLLKVVVEQRQSDGRVTS